MTNFLNRAGVFAGILAAFAICSSACAAPRDATGVWTRQDGSSRIEFKRCGRALCGYVIWLRNPKSKAHVGQQVFFDMVRYDQNTWRGSAFNPKDGETYSGHMILSGRRLKTAGCVLGGLICKTVFWHR
jgi:uncharacterized protein (DUF2147 family)